MKNEINHCTLTASREQVTLKALLGDFILEEDPWITERSNDIAAATVHIKLSNSATNVRKSKITESINDTEEQKDHSEMYYTFIDNYMQNI